jgi:microsomal epoxide hydrolase
MKDTAYLWNQLMTGLGFKQYAAQGGDIGSFLSWQLARDHEACIGASFARSYLCPKRTANLTVPGLHVNFLAIKAPPKGTPEFEKSTGPPRPQEVMKGLQAFGYALEQATRPSAIGMVVGSSPLALLTW